MDQQQFGVMPLLSDSNPISATRSYTDAKLQSENWSTEQDQGKSRRSSDGDVTIRKKYCEIARIVVGCSLLCGLIFLTFFMSMMIVASRLSIDERPHMFRPTV